MTAIIFDTETTGTQQPQVIEAAWLRVDHPGSLNITEEYEARFQPSEPISLGALATHHILDEELEGCPPASSFKLPARSEERRVGKENRTDSSKEVYTA